MESLCQLGVRSLYRLIVAAMLFALVGLNGTATAQTKTEVYPGEVVITAGTCVDGVATEGTATVPSDTVDDGIQYFLDGPKEDGSYTLRAMAGDGYAISDSVGAGWVKVADWRANYDFFFPDVPCADSQDVSSGSRTLVSGEVQKNETETPDSSAPLALPADCGSIPYPAPVGSNVSGSVNFSNYVITHNGVTHTGGPISLGAPDESLVLGFDWTTTGSLTGGQYFTFAGPVDTDGNKVFTSASQWFPVYNFAGSAEAGCASVVNGDITVQLTGYVDGRSGIGGHIQLDLFMAAGSQTDARTIDFSFDDDSNFSIEIPGTPSGSFGKRGWFMRDDQGWVDPAGAIRWNLHVPASPTGYTNLLLEDAAPADGSWTFSCGDPGARTATTWQTSGPYGPVAIDVVESCSQERMTLTVATVPANVSIDFYFSADVTPGMEGPFYNDASASALEMDTIRLPYEVKRTTGSGNADGIFVVSPQAPAIDHAVCVDEVNDTWVPAKVTLAPDTEAITYTNEPYPFPETGGHLIVTATLTDGYAWSSDVPEGWVLNEADNTMVYEADVLNDPCVIETPTPTVPADNPTPTVPPCVPPPPTECIPTPASDGTPEVPCEPVPTPTIPAWCLEPTPPVVNKLPNTGTNAEAIPMMGVVLTAGFAVLSIAAAAFIRHERS